MILKADAKQLEFRVKAFLAQDKIAIEEIKDPSRDIHAENQKVLNLPNRTISKIFLYRAIFADAFGEQKFRGPAYAYINDPNFSATSKSPDFWEGVIERFFGKYSEIYQHSLSLIRAGCERGEIISPSGRRYPYRTYIKWDGTPEWPRTQMLNHVVQGFSADLMILARRYAAQHWDQAWGVLFNTVHDDIEADVINDSEVIYSASCMLEDAFANINPQANKWFGIDLNVPMESEVKFGSNLHEDSMSKFGRDTFYETYRGTEER